MLNLAWPDFRIEQGGTILSSGVPAVVLGPLRVDRYVNKSFAAVNLGPAAAAVAFQAQVNGDVNGNEAAMGTAGAVPLRAPHAALWITAVDLGAAMMGSGVFGALAATPAPWCRIVAVATAPGLVASGYFVGSTT